MKDLVRKKEKIEKKKKKSMKLTNLRVLNLICLRIFEWVAGFIVSDFFFTLFPVNVNNILDRIWWHKDIGGYIHNAVWEKLHPNKTFFNN
jgi:hypothetical protein